MPDITMCVSQECPIRNECFRATAKPDSKYQSYADFYLEASMRDDLFVDCSYYIEAENEQNQKARFNKKGLHKRTGI